MISCMSRPPARAARRLAAAVAAAAACASLLPGQEPDPQALQDLLDRHARAVAGADLRDHGDLRLSGTIDGDGGHARVRVFVRRQPFAYRREVETAAGTEVTVSDGRYAWDEGGRPLPPDRARECLEAAFLDGLLYLDPGCLRGGAAGGEPYALRDHDALPAGFPRGLHTRWLGVLTPAGSLLQLHLDAGDLRLHEAASPDTPGEVRWHRFADWERAGGLLLPRLRASGVLRGAAVAVRRWTEVEVRALLADRLFEGCPAAAVPPVQDCGALEVVPHTLPGEVALLTAVRIGSQPVLAWIDTASDRNAVVPELAHALQLPPRAPIALTTMAGVVQAHTAWLDELEFGGRRLLQTFAPVLDLPAVLAAGRDRQPGLLLGAEALADSPVLDFRGGRLLCRGAPVQPLRELGGKGVLEVPLERQGRLCWVVVEVGGAPLRALVDTGTAPLLRLSAAALRRCGLPADAAHWQSAGAVATTGVDASGRRMRELVVSLPDFRLGPARFAGPLVHLGGLEDGAPANFEAILGAGALARFLRVGFDFERGLLELEPEAGAVIAGGVLELEAAAENLGLALASGPAAAPGGMLSVPVVHEVATGSPAAARGLRAGDRVLSVGGRDCAGLPARAVNRALWLRPGESVELEVLRADGVRRRVRLP